MLQAGTQAASTPPSSLLDTDRTDVQNVVTADECVAVLVLELPVYILLRLA